MQVESGALPQEPHNKHCTDAGNPFFSAELVGQVAVVDCQVTAAGLTAQLAAAVVRAEQPTLAAQQSELVAAIGAGRRQQVHHSWGVLEEEALQMWLPAAREVLMLTLLHC